MEEELKDVNIKDEITQKLTNTKKIVNSENAYRVKVDQNYRIGAQVEPDNETGDESFNLKRFLHRKDIYNKFPPK